MLFLCILFPTSTLTASLANNGDNNDAGNKAKGGADDYEMFEGDLMLPKEQIEAAMNGQDPSNVGGARKLHARDYRKWPEAKVYYTISSKRSIKKHYIYNAMKHWQEETCIKFYPRTNQKDYVEFVVNGGGCYSTGVGRQGGKQVINLGFFCIGLGIATHEIGHALAMSLICKGLGNMPGCHPDAYYTSTDRNKDYRGATGKCDNSSVLQWYRFTGDAGRQMATYCVPTHSCGTESPGWLSDGHPTEAQGIVERKVCFNWNRDCCYWSVNIRVRNCGDYYIYELSKAPSCNLRFCGENGLDLIHWPSGSYGIPRPATGCPSDSYFQWHFGSRYHDTAAAGFNYKSDESFHLGAKVTSYGVYRTFCMKTDTSTDKIRNPWPKGQYCIYRKGGTCPTNLNSGFVFWRDRSKRNKNTMSGTLPDGSYIFRTTTIYFCCRTDGEKRVPISLPVKEPFFLLAYNSSECQQVKWAVASREFIYYSTERIRYFYGYHIGHRKGGSYPSNIGDSQGILISYCYYRGCNNTLTADNGTFHSPNFPNTYPNGQNCSWKITVGSELQIHLTFTNFSLQSENNTDALYVYDGVNETGAVLGVFYGNHTPPEEGINSSANSMFVIFKSDQSVSFTGFKALYHTMGPTAILTTNSTRTPTPSLSVRGTPSSGVGIVAIVLIPLFGVAALLGVIAFIYCFINYRKKRALEARQPRTAAVEIHRPFDSVSVDRPPSQAIQEDSQQSSVDKEGAHERPPAFNPGLAGRAHYSSEEKTVKGLSRRTAPSIRLASYPREQVKPSAPPESALEYS